jgi:hypothetical protein
MGKVKVLLPVQPKYPVREKALSEDPDGTRVLPHTSVAVMGWKSRADGSKG